MVKYAAVFITVKWVKVKH